MSGCMYMPHRPTTTHHPRKPAAPLAYPKASRPPVYVESQPARSLMCEANGWPSQSEATACDCQPAPYDSQRYAYEYQPFRWGSVQRSIDWGTAV